MTDKTLLNFQRLTEREMIEKSNFFLDNISLRRTVRDFSDEDIPEEVILNAVKAAATAPNGANLQPWHFVIIKSRSVKSELRGKAEKIESEFYSHKASQEWLDDLKHFGTNNS